MNFSIAQFIKKLSTVVFACTLSIAFADQALPPNATYEVGFSPFGQSQAVILKGIESAKREILVAAYSFTSKPIAIAAANKNAENTLLLRNVPPLAHEYMVEWKRLWNESQDLKAAY